MKIDQASKAAQNHAELVRASVAQASTFVGDQARSAAKHGARAYSVAKPRVAQGLSRTVSTTEHGVRVALTYAGSFLRTLVARSGR